MQPQSTDRILQVLSNGEIELVGELVYGSNNTFLVNVVLEPDRVQGVYKPTRGERPLWDFPYGSLAAREVAAFEVCRAIGWDFVPPTVLREEAPAGAGSLQQYLNLEEDCHYFTLSEHEKERLMPVALFDALINNADRKGGHVLLAPDGHLWLIDHGLSFHPQDKLRTVIWDFAGQGIPPDLQDRLRSFLGTLKSTELRARLEALLSEEEIAALEERGERLLARGAFPRPGSGRPYPWPLV